MNTINGITIQQEILKALAFNLKEQSHFCSLSILLVGEDPRSIQYVRMKEKFGKELGVAVSVTRLPPHSSLEEVLETIATLQTPSNGVMVQLPLPEHLRGSTETVCRAITKEHDVDMLNPETIVAYRKGFSDLEPPVAGAVKHLLEKANITLREGNPHKIVVVGNGRTVGGPVADMLSLHKQKFQVVTKETSHEEIDELLSSADIIISGAGDPHFIKPRMIKRGVVLIDAGVSFVDGELRGDVDPKCYEKSSYYSPVPGGVGPVGIACLFENLVRLSKVCV